MSPCKYCNNLDISSYETVVQSRPPREYNALAAIPLNTPLGVKPHLTIEIDAIVSGTGVLQCDTCIMLRNAVSAVSNGSLNGVRELECQGNMSGTMDVTLVLHSGSQERFEFYTRTGEFSAHFFVFSTATNGRRDHLKHFFLANRSFDRLSFTMADHWSRRASEFRFSIR